MRLVVLTGIVAAALIAILADLGLRVGEVVKLDMQDLGHERGHRTIRVTGKDKDELPEGSADKPEPTTVAPAGEQKP